MSNIAFFFSLEEGGGGGMGEVGVGDVLGLGSEGGGGKPLATDKYIRIYHSVI